MTKSALSSIKAFLFGRPRTKDDVLQDRRRQCVAGGVRPDDVENFWTGIEELKQPEDARSEQGSPVSTPSSVRASG